MKHPFINLKNKQQKKQTKTHLLPHKLFRVHDTMYENLVFVSLGLVGWFVWFFVCLFVCFFWGGGCLFVFIQGEIQ